MGPFTDGNTRKTGQTERLRFGLLPDTPSPPVTWLAGRSVVVGIGVGIGIASRPRFPVAGTGFQRNKSRSALSWAA